MKVFLTVALAAVVLFIVGCGHSATPGPVNTNSNTTAAASPASTNSNTTAATSGSKADVVAAAKKFLGVKSFFARIDSMLIKQSWSEVKYAAPDRFHLKTPDSEVIVIGRRSWVKKSDGKWTAQADSDDAAQGSPRDFFKEDMLNVLTDVQNEGEESVGDQAAVVYSYKGVTPVGSVPFTTKLWVSKATGIPIKLHSEYQEGQLKSATVTYDTKRPVTIEPPM